MTKKSSLLSLLESFIAAYGPCGEEEEVRKLCKKEFSPFTEEIWEDAAGNLIGKISANKSTKPPLRIFVHMDELALIVKNIHEDGSLQVDHLGAIYPAALGQGPVEILGDTKSVSGIISYGCLHTTKQSPSIHKIMPTEYRGEGKAPFWNDVRIITRKTSQELESMGVHAGTRVVIPKSRRRLYKVGDCIAGYYLDNRAAIVIAIAALKEIKKASLKQDIYIVATTEEELGGFGASYAARTLPGDTTIAIDVGPVAEEYQTTLDPYPIVVYKDAASIYDKTLSDHLLKIGKDLQLFPKAAIFSHYGSDASLAHTRGFCGKTALLCFPVQNTHGYEITHKDSILFCARLLAKYLVS